MKKFSLTVAISLCLLVLLTGVQAFANGSSDAAKTDEVTINIAFANNPISQALDKDRHGRSTRPPA